MSAAARVAQLRAARRLDDAEREARRALAAEPEDVGLRIELAAVLIDADRAAQALPVAQAAVAGAPQEPAAYRVLALSLAELGRHDEALHAAYTAVTLGPESASSAICYSHVLQRAGRMPDAQDVAQRAVAIAPEDPRTHLQLADVASDRGDRDTARRAYAETLRLDPENAAARHDLAVLEINARRPVEGLPGLVEAGRLDPSRPETLRNVAAVLWQLSYRLRLVVVGTALAVTVINRGDPDLSSWTARAGGAAALAVVALVIWLTVRRLPAATGAAARAALRTDRPLAVTWAGLTLCAALLGAVAITGLERLATAALVICVLLALVGVVGGLVKRVTGRAGRR